MNDGPGAAADVALPLACTLGPEDGPARLLRWQRLHAAASPVVRRGGGELEVGYPPGPGVREELASLVAAEQLCCSFVTWTLTDRGTGPVLRVTAPPDAPDAVAPIAAMFASHRSAHTLDPLDTS